MAIGAGMLLHSLMDSMNTYGIGLLIPFVRRRYCAEVIFFFDVIDTTVTAGFFVLVAPQVIRMRGPISPWPAIGYAAFLCFHWAARLLIRRRAWRRRPAGTLSLIPSAFVPGLFEGYAENASGVRTFRMKTPGPGASTKRSRTRSSTNGTHSGWLG